MIKNFIFTCFDCDSCCGCGDGVRTITVVTCTGITGPTGATGVTGPKGATGATGPTVVNPILVTYSQSLDWNIENRLDAVVSSPDTVDVYSALDPKMFFSEWNVAQ